MEKTMEKQGTAVHEQTKLLVMTGLFIALGYVATTVLMVPSPTGRYMNLGDTVVLLESMKMEIPVLAEWAGVVREVRAEPGDVVQEGDVLVTVTLTV